MGHIAANQALKSLGFRSWRRHFSHSAVLRILPFVKTSFIFTSPPQLQKNFWVTIPTLAFLLNGSAMTTTSSLGRVPTCLIRGSSVRVRVKRKRRDEFTYQGRKVKWSFRSLAHPQGFGQ